MILSYQMLSCLPKRPTFSKLLGDLTKVIFILDKFTTFREKKKENKLAF